MLDKILFDFSRIPAQNKEAEAKNMKKIALTVIIIITLLIGAVAFYCSYSKKDRRIKYVLENVPQAAQSLLETGSSCALNKPLAGDIIGASRMQEMKNSRGDLRGRLSEQ